MLSRLCAQYRVWTTITSLSGTDSDPAGEDEPTVLTNRQVGYAVWVQSDEVNSSRLYCILG